MKRWLLCVLLLVTVALYIAPSQALAYSYGDANTEEIAETFKLVEASLAGASPNWKSAEDAYKVRRSEIVSHFGESVAVTLDNNFKDKNAKLTISNFKAVLVMNLDRRFTYAIEGFDDYAQTKLLLAKAKATFDTLKPYVGSKSDEVNAAFDEALEALGNPGLFGVGQKAAEPDVFKKKVHYIYGVVKPLFPYKASTKPAATAKPAATPKPAATAKPAATPKPAATAKPAATPKPAATQKPAVTVKPAAEQETTKPTDNAESEAPSATPAADAETVKPSAEADATATAEAAATATPAPAASETVESAEQNGTEAEAAASEGSGVVEESGKELAAHAPMEHADKTNPLVTVSVIGGVVLLAGAGVWLARKKKWF